MIGFGRVAGSKGGCAASRTVGTGSGMSLAVMSSLCRCETVYVCSTPYFVCISGYAMEDSGRLVSSVLRRFLDLRGRPQGGYGRVTP